MTDIFSLFAQIRQESPVASGPITHLVVGLGNPGSDYAATRHNAGFLCLDKLADTHHIRVNTAKFHALVGDGSIGGVRVLLMKPQTFMNLSGDAVIEAMHFYQIPPEQVIVICDDVNFDVGQFRIRLKGSHGGHNGLKSIAFRLVSDAYTRIKVGVGKKPHPDYDLADWVLGKFPKEDLLKMEEVTTQVAEAVRLLLEGKVDEARNRFSK